MNRPMVRAASPQSRIRAISGLDDLFFNGAVVVGSLAGELAAVVSAFRMSGSKLEVSAMGVSAFSNILFSNTGVGLANAFAAFGNDGKTGGRLAAPTGWKSISCTVMLSAPLASLAACTSSSALWRAGRFCASTKLIASLVSVPHKPSVQSMKTSPAPGLIGSVPVSTSTSLSAPSACVSSLRRGCVAASRGVISPLSTICCTVVWSLVRHCNAPPEKRYNRLSPTWAWYIRPSRSSTATPVVPMPSHSRFCWAAA